MGRIADALKKAEQQRREKLGHAGSPVDGDCGEAVAVVSAPSPVLDASGDELFGCLTAASGGAIGANEVSPPTAGMDESLVAYYDPSSVISEQYRGLRTRLLSQNPDNEHRTMAITSSLPRDGKTVTALNTAFILAEIRHLRVLVVDGDFRRSSLAGMLKLGSSPGLAELLMGEASYEEVLQPTAAPNLFFVAAGQTHGRSAAEVLSSQSATSIFATFRNQFHYTIIDTPPASTVTDVGIIGQWCNGVIMVVRLDKTPEPMAQRAVRLLQANNIPILGTVLVGGDRRSGGYGYYRYYRYYYTSDRERAKR
ncbi:MAG TPA: CpsD/CapB family tyrosine-protein kinase [Phycisphaerae bacterium]|nr:CpsD/CapB family tyrosine-protein kinase [Phycisphaerae bacterium]